MSAQPLSIAIAQLRAEGQIRPHTKPVAAPTSPQAPASTRELLRRAYERRCFICRGDGWCLHREPQVEIALMGGRA